MALLGTASAQETGPAPSPPASQASAPAGAPAAVHVVAASALGACFRRQPAYPRAALREEQEGQTLVAFTVTAAGDIEQPALVRSSGYPLLDQAALAHLNKCIAAFVPQRDAPLPPGRYALPMVWRLE
jgi:TonB family protein